MIDNKTIREYTILNKVINGGTHTDYETRTASGPIASFETNTDKNLIECKTSITPIQDTGIPSPNNPLPISGHTGLTVTRTGKNLFDADLLKDQVGWNTFEIKLSPNTTYTMSTNCNVDELPLYFTRTGLSPGSGTIVTSEHSTTLTTQSDGLVRIQQRRVSGDDSFSNYHWQIEAGNTATAYEPYTATTYPISWSEHGTVYGGDIDLITGIGKSKLGFITFDGSEDWDLYYPQDGFAISIPDMKIGSAMDGYCNILPVIKTSSQFGVRLGGSINDNKIYCCRIVGAIEGVTNVDTWKAFLSENNLTICYPLATEEDISIDPETISTINGINNIWSDTGDMEVKYLYEVEVTTSGVMKYLPFFYDFKGRRKDL